MLLYRLVDGKIKILVAQKNPNNGSEHFVLPHVSTLRVSNEATRVVLVEREMNSVFQVGISEVREVSVSGSESAEGIFFGTYSIPIIGLPLRVDLPNGDFCPMEMPLIRVVRRMNPALRPIFHAALSGLFQAGTFIV